MDEMQTKSDARLLREYAETGGESAFAEIVTRHTDLVYSAALRQVASSDLACDVAQNVFTSLARGAWTLAGKLNPDASLAGWLCRCTRNLALNLRRDDFRRQSRERQAMNDLLATSEAAPDWGRLRPLLDEAMSELSDPDHDALVLRYFQNQDLRAVGIALGISDDAAQKRVSRAVERLRELFAKRGVSVGEAGLVAVISANAVQAAPAGLALTISGGVAVAGTAAATTTAQIVAMTTLQKVLITTTVAVLAGTGAYQGLQASRLRDRIETLQRQQAPFLDQLAMLSGENERLSNQVVQALDANALSQAQLSELLKLRGLNPAPIDVREIARLKTTVEAQRGRIPDSLADVVVASLPVLKKLDRKKALEQMARMKEILHFTPDQELSVSNILMMRVERQSQIRRDQAMSRDTHEDREQPDLAKADDDNAEAEIKALLTAQQLAAYPDYIQQEKRLEAEDSARLEIERATMDLTLSDEQREKARQRLSELKLKDATGELARKAMIEARRNGRPAEGIQIDIELQKAQLDRKLEALRDILTPEQLDTYREEQLKEIEMNEASAKMESLRQDETIR